MNDLACIIRRASRKVCQRLALIGVLAIPSACSSESPPETLPPLGPPSVESRQVGASAADVFFDVSRGVEGFLPDPQAKPQFNGDDYLRLLQDVPDLADRLTHRVSLNAFGTTVRPLGWQARRDLQKREFYRCKPSEPCINGTSELGAALRGVAAADASKLIVVVTPLELTPPSLADLSTDVTGPLAAALRTQRSVGILGLRAQFSGNVYNLVPEGPYKHVGERGIYVVAIGSYGVIREFFETLAGHLSEERRKLTIFTGTPVCRTLPTSELVDGWKPSDGIKGTRGLIRLRLQDGEIAPPQLRLARGSGGIESTFDINEKGGACPHVALPTVDTALDESLWVYMNSRWQAYSIPTRASTQQKPENRASTADVDQDGSRITVRFLTEWTRTLLPERTFFYQASVRTKGFAKESRAVRWLKDWTLAGPPVKAPFLRTPLLGGLGELLLTASSQSHESVPVAAISAVFRTE